MQTDIGFILQPFHTVLWLMIPLMVVTSILKVPWVKGLIGEFLVNTLARLFLAKGKYHVIKDVTLATDDGTTQIDHIIVSRYGVFVIETKNMKGWIFGSANQKIWTQKIYKHSSEFQNPLHQNYKHVKTLEGLLSIPATAIHSLVVFIGSATFKTEMPANVTHAGAFLRYIKSMNTMVLSQAEVDGVIADIEQLRLQPGLATTRQHVRYLQQKHAAIPPVESPTTPQCPKCGSEMVLRTVKTGQNAGRQVWGCYPTCRGIVQRK